MNKANPSNQTYETKGVYGDEEKFVNGTSDRLGKMIEIVKNLTKPVVRQFDKLFSLSTKLASGLLLIFIKEKA